MAASIITKRPERPERKVITDPEIYSKDIRNVVVDERYENLANLIVHIEGSNWRVNYYQQLLNDETAVAGHNPTKDEIYQQYLKIENMILKVDTALNWQQNNEWKSGTTVGSAHVYPPFIPNQGDMFIGDAGDGHAVIFQVTVSEKLSMFKQSVYRIEYQATGYADGDRLRDLESKVVDRRFFDMDFLEHGQNPVLIKEDYQHANTIRHYYKILAENYFKKYYSTRFRCMILPRDDIAIYDHFMTRMVSHWFSSDDYYKLLELSTPPVENIKAMSAESIFDLIEDQDQYAFSDIFSRVGCISLDKYSTWGRLPQASRMGLDLLIYPIDHSYSVDTQDKHSIKVDMAPTPVPDYSENQYKGVFNERYLIPVIDLNESYIFSKNFYKQELPLLSLFEIQVCRYLEGNNIIKEVIVELLKTHAQWSPLQQFYLTPILLMLMKASLRGI